MKVTLLKAVWTLIYTHRAALVTLLARTLKIAPLKNSHYQSDDSETYQ